MITWEETAALMMSTDYRERFRAEYWQLCHRIERLTEFIEDYDCHLYPCPIGALQTQLAAMKSYKLAMEKRSVVEEIAL